MTVLQFPLPRDETKRLRLLSGYRVAGTPPEPEYDRFADLAAKFFNVPVALITFVDKDKVWIKARSGLELTELSRGDAFCAHTILANDVFVIPDTRADSRFAENPVVAGPPHARFYAGAPLVAEPGSSAIGTLCLLDVAPRPPLTDQEQRALADLASMVVDRLEKRRLALLGHDATERFLKIAATSRDAIICADGEGGILFWNESAEAIFGRRNEDALGKNASILVPEHGRTALASWLDRVKRRPGIGGKVELECLRADGGLFPAEISFSSWTESGGIAVCGVVRDVTARRQAETRLRHLATRDSLTGLANRAAFLDRLETVARKARSKRSRGTGCALLLIDLDRFKEVNDAFGHGAGDRVLQRLARRLDGLASDTVHPSRLSGDEFTIVIEGNGGSENALALAERARIELCRPFRVYGQQIDVGASIGVATFPEHATTSTDLLANADLALYRAKAEGGNRVVLYVSALRDAALSRRQVESELRRAERGREFVLYYQPQVSIIDGSILGAEALLRWTHPKHGVLAPADFLSVLETSAISSAVGAWVIDTAVAQAAEWTLATGRPFRVGVNLFASQFLDSDFATAAISALDRHGLPGNCLELEITENIAIRHDAGLATPLRRLVDAGVGIALDDFGTGYGSLSHLKRLPVSRLKIDRSFIQGILTDAGDAAIVRAVLALGRSLGLGVIAEGVENESQRVHLHTLGCTEAQGFLFGRPMPAHDFAALLTGSAREVA